MSTSCSSGLKVLEVTTGDLEGYRVLPGGDRLPRQYFSGNLPGPTSPLCGGPRPSVRGGCRVPSPAGHPPGGGCPSPRGGPCRQQLPFGGGTTGEPLEAGTSGPCLHHLSRGHGGGRGAAGPELTGSCVFVKICQVRGFPQSHLALGLLPTQLLLYRARGGRAGAAAPLPPETSRH